VTRVVLPRASVTPRRRFEAALPAENRERRAQVVDLAFLLLGGRKAASMFLSTRHPDLGGVPSTIAMSSQWGLVEVVRVMRRHAAGDDDGGRLQ